MSTAPDAAAKAEKQQDVDQKESPDASNTRIAFYSPTRLLGPVQKDHADLALLACCLVTGMVDAASFSNWST